MPLPEAGKNATFRAPDPVDWIAVAVPDPEARSVRVAF